MRDGKLGAIDTPKQQNNLDDVAYWCADNGCYGKGYPGDLGYLNWLAKRRPDVSRCAFATAPDVVGDAKATLKRSAPFLPIIRAMGYPAALVGQDGLEELEVPYDSFDVFFIGGTTEWKLSAGAHLLAYEAKRKGKRVHMGRVNSRKRLRYAASIDCDSADGTLLAFGPDFHLPRILGWLEEINHMEAA